MDPDTGLQSACELLELMESGAATSVQLVEHYLARQERYDTELNAVVTVDREGALAAAAAADERRAARGELPPLLGLPMTIKDAVAVGGLRCTGGATELRDHVAPRDAEVVARLRAAGAVIMGKTNLPRWSGDCQAFNDIFGTTNNPWDLACGPGGSSGGASAAVSAGLTAAEIGTDIGGSVRLPAHFAGVCGHKPSFGIVPQRGYVSHATYATSEPDVNVVGPITRRVEDLELLFDVIAGPSEAMADGWRLDLPAPRATELSDLRIAVHLDDPACPVGRDVAACLDDAVAALREKGATLTEAWPDDVDFGDVHDVGLPLISAATSPARTDEEYAMLRRIAGDPGGAEPSMVMRARASAIGHRDWLALAERRDVNRLAWAEFFEDHDVLLAPVAVRTAFEHHQEGSLYERTVDVDGEARPYADLITWTSQFGYVWLPATVVPVGIAADGHPVGIQIVGPFLGDRTTLALARHIEALCGGTQVPPLLAQ